MRQDAWGNAVTAANDDAVKALDETVKAYLGFRLDTGEHLEAALTADPAMPLALIYRGFFYLLFCDPRLAARAVRSRDEARQAIEQGGANARERLHMRALEAWVAGDWGGIVEAFERILLDHPRDPIAARLAHYFHFYMNGARAMRQSSARILPAWDEGLPSWSYMHAVHGFALEESGDYAGAERHARLAVEVDPADIWGVHAMAHVLEMQGRHDEGIAWVNANADAWRNTTNNFRFHVWWHRCLYHLELGRTDAVLALYDREVRGELTDEYLDMTNGAAMLWRLEQEGVDVGERWAELADRSAEKAKDHLLCFADLHYVMALAATGRTAEGEALIDYMRETALDEATTQGRVYREIGIALAEALMAARAGRHDRAVDLLLPVRDRIALVGGSHAQRDVFERTLLESALAAGRASLARALTAERIDQRRMSPYNWRRRAAALRLCGDMAGATAAEREAALLAA